MKTPKKSKKLFAYKGETINSKELDEDLRKAQYLIDELKRKSDPREERLYRRHKYIDSIGFFVLFLCMLSLCFTCFFSGIKIGIQSAEAMYKYSVTTGIVIPEE